jgi:membrane protease YdiL (CAAX protease family)
MRQKVLLSSFQFGLSVLLPLAYGLMTWLISWKYHFFVNTPFQYQLTLALKAFITLSVCYFLFSKYYIYNAKNFIPVIRFNDKEHLIFFISKEWYIPIPAWYFFIGMLCVSVLTSFLVIPLWEYTFLHALIVSIIITPILEEFVTRSLFVASSRSFFYFLILNILNSVAFTFMHLGYNKEMIDINQLFNNGYFEFNFALNCIAYKTKRIELTCLIHMLSNIINMLSIITPQAYLMRLITVILTMVFVAFSAYRINKWRFSLY